MRTSENGTRRPEVVAGYFVDVEAGERLGDDDKIDAHGVDLIGFDEDGFWWGTERAAWVLFEHPYVVIVHGTLGRHPWDGYFVGTEEAAIEYAETHGVVVSAIESGDPEYEARQLRRYRQRQHAQRLLSKE
jgi:hypothetical protein